MKAFQEAMEAAFNDADLQAEEIPRLELYMDQILTLVEEGLAPNKRREADKLLTKTMVNNYSKEKLILPIKGKKYSREQVMQLLCILNLKQNLILSDIKALTPSEEEQVCFEEAYKASLMLKQRIKENLPAFLQLQLGDAAELHDPEKRLALVLALSSGATYLRRICEQLIDE